MQTAAAAQSASLADLCTGRRYSERALCLRLAGALVLENGDDQIVAGHQVILGHKRSEAATQVGRVLATHKQQYEALCSQSTDVCTT